MGYAKDFVEQHPEAYQLLTVLAVLGAIYRYVLYPIYFHPLAAIPGPTLAKLTKYWIVYQEWAWKRNCVVQDLHDRYGSIVRLGPDEVDISDLGYQKEIYMNNFDKTSFYAQFNNYGKLNTFSSLTKAPHQKSRKVSNKFYSKSSVSSPPFQKMVSECVAKELRWFDELSVKKQNAPINVYDLLQMLAMDSVAMFSFGSKVYKPLLDDPQGYGTHVIDQFRVRSSLPFWTTTMPQFRKYVQTKEVIEASAFGKEWIFKNAMAALEEDSDAECLANVLLQGGKDRMSVASECSDHVAAGYVTTGVTLSYCLWQLSQNPETQRKLRAELQTVRDQNQGYTPSKYQDIEDLPYMNAVLNETFRLHAAIPGQEPRLAPPHGLKWRGSKQAPECLIPAGTVVTMQPWTLHRDASIFEDPEIWNPERWLIDDEDKLKAMHKQLMTFGNGVRMCIGMHLAMEEMKLLLTGIYSRFSTELDPSFDYNHNMHMEDLYTIHPRGHRCDLKFYSLT